MILALLGLLLAGCMPMSTVTLQPTSTVLSVWDEVPTDGLGHHLKVDEGVSTPDDASTYISRTAGGINIEQLGLASMPADFFRSTDVRLRCRARADTFGVTLAFLFLVDGVDVYGGTPPSASGQFFDWSVLPLNTWSTLTFSLPSPFPVLHGDETLVIALQGAGTVIDVTAVELEIDYITKPPRPRGVGISRVPTAGGISGSPAASGRPVLPSSSGAAVARSFIANFVAGSAAASAQVPSVAHVARVPVGSMADPGKPSASGRSMLPTATASPMNPTVTAQVINRPTGSPE